MVQSQSLSGLIWRSIYNAACLVRDSWRGSAERRAECTAKMVEAVLTELARTEDREAALYAIADALYCLAARRALGGLSAPQASGKRVASGYC